MGSARSASPGRDDAGHTGFLTSPPRWGLPDALLCFVAGFITANAGVGLWQEATGDGPNSLGVAAAGLVSLWVGLLGSMVLVSRAKGTGSFATDFALRFERARDLIGVAIGVGFQIVAVPLIYIPISRFISDLDERLEAPARELADSANSDLGLIVLGVLVVVGAPIVEELFYRGLLFGAIQRRFGDNPAIVGSAVAFAVAHFEPLQVPALFALAVVLAVLRVRYGRLGPSIFAHAGFNAVTMAVLVSQQN